MTYLSRVWRAIQPRAKHAIGSTLEQQASRLDVGYRFLFLQHVPFLFLLRTLTPR